MSSGNGLHNAQVGGVIGLNAVENNYLTENYLEKIKSGKLTQEEAEKLSQFLDAEVNRLCSNNPRSDACRTGISAQIQYIVMQEAWDIMRKDVSRTSKDTFDYLYNTEGANNRLVIYMNTIDNRANFFGASNQYEKHLGVGARWFGGAENVSRAFITGLGADGNASYLSFGFGKILDNPDLYGWRKEAGDALMTQGFNHFKELFNHRPNAIRWDIQQLQDEQTLLQPIHEKYLGYKRLYPFREISSGITGVNILDYQSRMKYRCKLLGYTEQQGCKP